MSSAQKRILVVDDDDATRGFIVDALRVEGYQVLPVSGGQGALEYLESCGQDQPDVIVLDLYMPLVDGREFARAYRRLPVPHAQMLVTTAVPDARRQAAEIGAAGALAKPFTLDALLREIRRQTQERRAA